MCDIGRVISDIGDSIASFSKRAITAPGTGGLEAIAEQQGAAAKASADQLSAALARQNDIADQGLTFAKSTQAAAAATQAAALADQKKANDLARASSIPAVDSEAARLSADSALRRLLSANPFGAKRGKARLGDAPLGYRTATGA